MRISDPGQSEDSGAVFGGSSREGLRPSNFGFEFEFESLRDFRRIRGLRKGLSLFAVLRLSSLCCGVGCGLAVDIEL